MYVYICVYIYVYICIYICSLSDEFSVDEVIRKSLKF